MHIVGAIIRFIVAAIVLMLVGYVVPGFSHLTFGEALVAAVVIAVVSWIIEQFLGHGASTFGNGILGFVVSAAVIWVSQFAVPAMHVSLAGALLAALVIGIVDLFVPTGIR